MSKRLGISPNDAAKAQALITSAAADLFTRMAMRTRTLVSQIGGLTPKLANALEWIAFLKLRANGKEFSFFRILLLLFFSLYSDSCPLYLHIG